MCSKTYNCSVHMKLCFTIHPWQINIFYLNFTVDIEQIWISLYLTQNIFLIIRWYHCQHKSQITLLNKVSYMAIRKKISLLNSMTVVFKLPFINMLNWKLHFYMSALFSTPCSMGVNVFVLLLMIILTNKMSECLLF